MEKTGRIEPEEAGEPAYWGMYWNQLLGLSFQTGQD
jgi:hypothetical protein